MKRRTRMVLLTLFGPALVTVAFFLVTLVPLALIGITYQMDRILAGVILFFGFWQISAIWWLWKNWGEPPSNEDAPRSSAR